MVEATSQPKPERADALEAPQLFNIGNFVRNLLYRRSWFIGFVILDIAITYAIITSPAINDAWRFIIRGINVTIQITIVAFLIALVLGLITALGRVSKNAILYNLSTFYVELFRGLPLLVIIMIFAFVVTPAIVDAISGGVLDDLMQRLLGMDSVKIAETDLRTRDVEMVTRIMLAFAMTYGAFMSEVFRAGIESIGRGQMEAARSLGMNYVQAMRHVILPQAVRNVLPALANNFVLLLKDTSLATVVAVPEISHLTKQYSSNRFRYPEGLLVLSFLYANLTIILSMGVYYLEARLQVSRKD
jgi:polar amino acid transport system permease protein